VVVVRLYLLFSSNIMYTFGGEKLGKGSSGGRERYVAAVGAMEMWWLLSQLSKALSQTPVLIYHKINML
ncbi:MAG: hypothetical protein WA364_19435, partial [Candidatus Nitrosopolaris sp.]